MPNENSIDQLSIKISANGNTAKTNVEKLAESVKTLRDALGGMNSGGIRSLINLNETFSNNGKVRSYAKSLNSVTTALKRLENVNTDKVKELKGNLEAIGSVKLDNLKHIDFSGLAQMTKAMSKAKEQAQELQESVSGNDNRASNSTDGTGDSGGLSGTGSDPISEATSSVGTIKRMKMDTIALKEELRGVVKVIEDIAKTLAKVSLKGLEKGLKTVGKGVLAAGKGFLGLAKGVTSSDFSFKKGLKTVLKYGFGIRSLYVLVKRLKATFVEGAKSMATQSSVFNSSISSMSSSLNYMKGSLTSAFAPIVNVVAPYISALMDMIADALNAVGQFFAALTGQSTYMKAIKVQKDYAASLGGTKDSADGANKSAKELQKTLMGFDEINKLNEDNSGGGSGGSGGGGGAGGGAGDAYQFVEASSEAMSGFADMVKEAWANADFTEIGGMIGEKLKEGLDSIPWEPIQAMAEKIGKSVATLINGFIETAGLGESIGKTVGEAINTGISGAKGFIDNIHFESIGTFVADGMNGFFGSVNFDQAGLNLANALSGVFKSAKTWAGKFDFSEATKQVVSGINSFFGNISWGDFKEFTTTLGKKLGESVTTFAKEFKLSDVVTGAVNFSVSVVEGFTEFLNSADWDAVGQAIIEGFEAVDWKAVADALWELFKAVIEAVFDLVKGAFAKVGDLVMGGEDADEYLATVEVTGNLTGFNDNIPASKKNIDNFLANLESCTDKIDKKTLDDWTAIINNNRDKITDKDLEGFNAFLVKAYDGTLTDRDIEDMTAVINKLDSSGLGSTSVAVGSAKPNNVDDSAIRGKTANINQVKANTLDIPQKGAVLKEVKAKKITSSSKSLSVDNASVKNIKTPGNTTITFNKVKLTKQAKDTLSRVGISTAGFEKGGIINHGIIRPLPQYASGGLPTHGTHFIAGENGAEIVGNIGGKTEVLNRSQIASAIYSAVVKAMSDGGGSNVNVYLQGDANKMFKVVQTEANKYQMSTGKPAFNY